jgi:hypothetical protein
MAWIAQRLLAGIEAAVYGPMSLVSGWFEDDPGYGGRDLLADHGEVGPTWGTAD